MREVRHIACMGEVGTVYRMPEGKRPPGRACLGLSELKYLLLCEFTSCVSESRPHQKRKSGSGCF
jgi:hypothetical protein